MEKIYKNCQSCGMPLKKDEKGGGTNANGSKSAMYCSYCYELGKFTWPDITVTEMKERVKGKLKEMGFPSFITWFFTSNISRLERWKTIKAILILIISGASILASAQFHPQDSILFEMGTVPVKIYDLTTNIWQIGTPQKTYLNAAWSPPKGMITETAIPYPINTYSVFSFVINSKSLKQDYATYLTYMTKFDTDSLVDRGTIEASYNGGGVWCELGNTGWTCPDGPALISWDQDSSVASHKKYNHNAVTSGKSDGWLFSRCHLYWVIFDKAPGAVIPDSVMVRFIFTSDGTPTGKEGWLIDNIVFGYEDYFTGVSETPPIQTELAIVPNPVTSQSVIKFRTFPGKVSISIFDRAGRLMRQASGIKPDSFKIDRQEYAPGLYLLKMEDQQGRLQTARFIVQ
jgi:hypothetical protein